MTWTELWTNLLVHMEQVVDGAEGFISEHGTESPYWRSGTIAKARQFLGEAKKAKVLKSDGKHHPLRKT